MWLHLTVAVLIIKRFSNLLQPTFPSQLHVVNTPCLNEALFDKLTYLPSEYSLMKFALYSIGHMSFILKVPSM